MRPLVDGGVLLELIKPKPAEKFLSWAESLKRIHLSAVTVEEFESALGRRAGTREKASGDWTTQFFDNHCDILPVSPQIARTAAQLRAACGRQGRHLNQIDGIVAATSRVHRLSLVTTNPTTFAGCEIVLQRLV